MAEAADDEHPPAESNGNAKGQAAAEEENGNSANNKDASLTVRSVFLGNLRYEASATAVADMFAKPPSGAEGIAVDRVDMKRGFCFVFLQQPSTMEEKERMERFVSELNGQSVEGVSPAVRAEFARGDGNVRKKEDARKRANIPPSETLFVVNFDPATTKQEHLQMLFEPYGELVRIDIKGNYAFVQFQTVDQATQAKESVDGGRLNQNKLTVEFVAQRQRAGGGRGPPPPRGGGGGGRYYDDRRRDDYRRDDYRRGPPPPSYRDYDRGRERDGYYPDDRYASRDRYPSSRDGGGGRYPPPMEDRGGGRYARSRSRSRSPPPSRYAEKDHDDHYRRPPPSSYASDRDAYRPREDRGYR